MSKKESPTKRKSEYDIHIQKALDMMAYEIREQQLPQKKARKPESQKLPINFFEFKEF